MQISMMTHKKYVTSVTLYVILLETPKNQERLRRIQDTKTQEFYYQYYLWEYYFRDQETKDDRNKAVEKAKKQWEINYKRYSLEIYGVEKTYVDTLGGEDCPLTNEIINNGHLCTWFLDMV